VNFVSCCIDCDRCTVNFDDLLFICSATFRFPILQFTGRFITSTNMESSIDKQKECSTVWLSISNCFTSCSSIFHSYSEVTVAGEEMKNFGLFLVPLNKEGSGWCHTCCDMRPRLFWSHLKDCPIRKSPLTTRKRMTRTYSNPNPHETTDFLDVKLTRYVCQ
jgi:hypothetical protein